MNRFTRPAKSSSNLDIIILCAGSGRRMSSYGNKSFLKYKNKPIIKHQINLIRKVYPKGRLHIVTGYEKNRFKEEGVHYYHNSKYEETGNARSLKVALERLKPSNLLVINGDIIFNKHAITIPDKTKPYLFYDQHNLILKTKPGSFISENTIECLNYHPPQKWIQIFYLPKLHIPILSASLSNSFKNEKTHEIINKVLNQINFYPIMNEDIKALEINSMSDLENECIDTDV